MNMLQIYRLVSHLGGDLGGRIFTSFAALW